MSTNKDHSMRDKQSGGWQENSARDAKSQHEDDKDYLAINKDISGNDLTEENRDEIRHHQAFGNRHYESHRNHSSAEDQPGTNTSL